MKKIILFTLCFLLTITTATAAEQLYGPNGMYVSNERGQVMTMVADGEGNYIYAWPSDPNGNLGGNIPKAYVRKMNEFGEKSWAQDFFIDVEVYRGKEVYMAADGQGGAYVVFRSKPFNSWRIMASHISGEGEDLWGGPVTIANSPTEATIQDAFSDDGNLFVVYTRRVDYGQSMLYAARRSFSNDNAFNKQVSGDIYAIETWPGKAIGLPDHDGGLFVAWQSEEYKIELARYDSEGNRHADWLVSKTFEYPDEMHLNAFLHSSAGSLFFQIQTGPLGQIRQIVRKLDWQGNSVVDWPEEGIEVDSNTRIIEPDHSDGFFTFVWKPQTCCWHGPVRLQRFSVDGTPAEGWESIMNIDGDAYGIAKLLVTEQDEAIIIWNDFYGTYNKMHYLARKYGHSGEILFQTTLLRNPSLPNGYTGLDAALDSSGGMIAVFGADGSDNLHRPPTQVIAQRINQENINLEAGKIACDAGQGWQDCTTLHQGQLLDRIAIECFDTDYGVNNARISIQNRGISYNNGWTTILEGNQYIWENANTTLVGGNWTIEGTCHGLYDESDTAETAWYINAPVVDAAGHYWGDVDDPITLYGSAIDQDGTISSLEWVELPASCHLEEGSVDVQGLGTSNAYISGSLLCTEQTSGTLRLQAVDDQENIGFDDAQLHLQCLIKDVALTECEGGTCEEGESIQITATYSNSCDPDVLQLDFIDDSDRCMIKDSGGDMQGIHVPCEGNTCQGSWTVPRIHNDCTNKVVDNVATCLWRGDIGSGEIPGCANDTGLSFSFSNCYIPLGGDIIQSDVVLCPGVYDLDEGLTIANNDVTLDCNNAILRGVPDQNGITVEDNKMNSAIQNCDLRDWRNGIHLRSISSCLSRGHTIRANEISNSASRGISVATCDNVITGNSIDGGIFGIRSEFPGNVIERNTVENADTGVYATGLNDTIRDNVIRSNRIGIRFEEDYAFQGAGLGLIQGNEIADNVETGLIVVSSLHVDILDNTIRYNGKEGLSLSVSEDIEVSNNEICYNSVADLACAGNDGAFGGQNALDIMADDQTCAGVLSSPCEPIIPEQYMIIVKELVDDGAVPLQGALVQVQNQQQTTNENGVAGFMLPEMAHTFTISKEGYVTETLFLPKHAFHDEIIIERDSEEGGDDGPEQGDQPDGPLAMPREEYNTYLRLALLDKAFNGDGSLMTTDELVDLINFYNSHIEDPLQFEYSRGERTGEFIADLAAKMKDFYGTI
ncbi:MAG: right-handed parallel beta-helix repeat-containing protein [Nanoarchaeota archaeon]